MRVTAAKAAIARALQETSAILADMPFRPQPGDDKESVVEKYLARQVKAAGGEVRKTVWPGHRGAPDRFVMLPGRAATWVELKAPRLKARFPSTPHERQQAREHAVLRRFGQRVLLIDSKADVDALVAGRL